jgi:hypothetical protein
MQVCHACGIGIFIVKRALVIYSQINLICTFVHNFKHTFYGK